MFRRKNLPPPVPLAKLGLCWLTADRSKEVQPPRRLTTEERNLEALSEINERGLFKQEGPIQLMSGHKAKGLEYETVFHLDPWRIPSRFAHEGTEEFEQELNVRYVIETRFKQNLYLVTTEGWT